MNRFQAFYKKALLSFVSVVRTKDLDVNLPELILTQEVQE